MIDLYYCATPNGLKMALFFAETGLPHRVIPVDISRGDQFKPAFLTISPNNKIPAMVDHDPAEGTEPVVLFESGAMLLYLAEKTGQLMPTDLHGRMEVLKWLFWQVGSAPYLGGGFGHFYAYAPEKFEYPINRFTMEVKRQLDVLDKQLAKNEFVAGAEYTIADMAIWPWYGALVKGLVYGAAEFLAVHEYKNVMRWTDAIAQRPAVRRGRMVNRITGDPASQLPERHDASDFEKAKAAG